MSSSIRDRLQIPMDRLEAINAVLLDPNTRVVRDLIDVVDKYGTPEEINAKGRAAGELEALMARVESSNPQHAKDLKWLQEQCARGAFTTVTDYRKGVLGDRAAEMTFADDSAVTLEVSALQYFPWLMSAAGAAIENKTLIPGRFIRVRMMKEQENDGDLLAVRAGMKILGCSCVETLDTKGTDGSNVHLGGPETITGYFGGVGQPNEHALQWIDEFLYYYTNFGVREVLNINPGTVLLGYLLHRLGVDIRFKISVFMGNDNPYAALWTLLGAKLFAREDGCSPLIGFNWSNSVNNETMEIVTPVRQAWGFEDNVRFEHHITETWKSIVRQPYDRRDELLQLADHVPNISAKHEGGDPEVDGEREHPSDILDYFRERSEIQESGDMAHLEGNFLDKVDACNHTARSLTERGLSWLAAPAAHAK